MNIHINTATPVVFAAVGLVVYIVAKGNIKEVGRISFFAGLLASLMQHC